MRRFFALLAAASLALVSLAPATAATPQQAAVVAPRPTPAAPASTTNRSAYFDVNNLGSAWFSNPNIGLYDSQSAATNCVSGKSPTPFGMPCSGSGTTISQNQDWFQGVFFRTSVSGPPSLVMETMMSGPGASMSTLLSAGTSGFNGGSDRGIGIYDYAQNSGQLTTPGLQFVAKFSRSNLQMFSTTQCGGSYTLQPWLGPILQRNHGYLFLWGMKNGYSWAALMDTATGQPVPSSSTPNPLVCTAASITGASTFMGSGTTTIASSSMVKYWGLGPSALSPWHAGFGGAIGPVFSMVGSFPGAGNTVDATLLSNLALGKVDFSTNAKVQAATNNTVTCQAYYPLSDIGTFADSCGNYSNLTTDGGFSGMTAPTAKAPPTVASTTVRIDETQQGMVYRVDPSTVSLNGSGLVCYGGSPATGTIYRTGTWSTSAGGSRPTQLVWKLYNSSDTLIATRVVKPNSDGTWRVAHSGVAYGQGYYDSIEWQNSSARKYTAGSPFDVGVVFGVDGQSEVMKGIVYTGSGRDVGIASERVSLLQQPPGGVNGSATGGKGYDEANVPALLRQLDSINTPGTEALFGGSSGLHYATWSSTTITNNQQPLMGNGFTAMAKSISAWSGCPTMIIAGGRSGHGRGQFAVDHLNMPRSDVTSTGYNSWSAVSGNTVATGLAITQAGFSSAWMLPGSLKITIPYAGGSVIATDDGRSGTIAASDGTTGYTNYGLNSLQTDTPALFGTSGLGIFTTPTTAAGGNLNYRNYVGCEINTDCQATGTNGKIVGQSNSIAAGSTFSSSGTICLNQPPIPAAILSTFCPSGIQISVTSGVTTVQNVIDAINNSAAGALVTASLSASKFQLVPVSSRSISMTTGAACTGACLSGLTMTWTTDYETEQGTGVTRGQWSGASGTTVPTMQPSGFGVFGDGVNCGSGFVTSLYCQAPTPINGLLEVAGASDSTGTNIQSITSVLVGQYKKLRYWDPTTPVVIQPFHRHPTSTPTSTSFSTVNGRRAADMTIAASGSPYKLGGYCGYLQIIGNAGPHPDLSYGGAALYGQCLGESLRAAFNDTRGVGPVIASAAWDTNTGDDAACSTTGKCIKVTFTLGGGDTALTTVGGQTSAAGNGPSSCATNTAYTDGDITAICVSAYAGHRFNVWQASTAYSEMDIWSSAAAGNTTDGQLYLVTGGTTGTMPTRTGTSGGSTPINGSTVLAVQGSGTGGGGFTDGTTGAGYIGPRINYDNSLPLYTGMYFVSPKGCTPGTDCNVYEVVSTSVSSPVGRSCWGFLVGGYTSATSVAAYDQEGYQVGGTGSDSTKAFTCKILSATEVLLKNTTSTWTGTNYVLYAAGGDQQYNPANFSPIYKADDKKFIAQHLAGNRGLVGLTYATLPGMPATPQTTGVLVQ